MNKEIESHILLCIGAATRSQKNYLNLNEKMIYIIFFLMTEDNKKLRTKLYYFKKGVELPESDLLKQCLRSPRWFKDHWEITEEGIKLTNKGIDKFRYLMRQSSSKHVLESFIAIISEIVMNRITLHELELRIQLKYPDYATKYTDMIDAAVKANPNLNRSELLKQLQNTDFIHEQIKKAVFVNLVETRKYGKGNII